MGLFFHRRNPVCLSHQPARSSEGKCNPTARDEQLWSASDHPRRRREGHNTGELRTETQVLKERSVRDRQVHNLWKPNWLNSGAPGAKDAVSGPQRQCPPGGQMLKKALKYLFKNLTYWWKANLSVLLPVVWSGWRSGHTGQPAATSSLEPLDRWMAQERSFLLGEAAESPWAPQERPHHPLPSTPSACTSGGQDSTSSPPRRRDALETPFPASFCSHSFQTSSAKALKKKKR